MAAFVSAADGEIGVDAATGSAANLGKTGGRVTNGALSCVEGGSNNNAYCRTLRLPPALTSINYIMKGSVMTLSELK